MTQPQKVAPMSPIQFPMLLGLQHLLQLSKRQNLVSTGNLGKKTKALRITTRDLEILFALFTARYLTTDQCQQLFFRESKGGQWGRIKACQQRMKRLFEHGLVRRIERPIKRGSRPLPFVYTLDRKGAELLISELGVEVNPSDWQLRAQEEHYPFLDHLLTTTDMRISVLHACQPCGVTLEDWIDEKELKSSNMVDHVTISGPHGGELRTAVVPDGYFKLCRDERYGLFFLEIDLKNVTIAPSLWERRGWTRKFRAYLAYFKSEAYQHKYGTHRARVLTITSGAGRLQNIKQACEAVFEELANSGEDTRDQGRFWFATFDEALDPTKLLSKPIWQVAGSDTPRALLE